LFFITIFEAEKEKIIMSLKGIIRKIFSPVVFWNFFALILATVLVLVGLWYWMAYYTRHGQSVEVPNVKDMLLNDAEYALGHVELEAVVIDSSYNRNLPAGTVLDQLPQSGNRVKAGREIYLTINSRQAPTLAVPDIADNCSIREAEAKLKALGFKLGPVEYVPGDKDWVLGVKCNGRTVNVGERIPSDMPLVLVVGNSDVSGDFDGDGWEDDESWEEGEVVTDADAMTGDE
jgi:beta-lactam-binding protein with PASTA domain